ncbi:hypothetical protein ACFQ48_10565 [Hymenobacter caeli]|uniref:FCP1 homology domain-containing protein n=1 Tax=Hymenobacter caeli TaxID=2735894 RepID=A0ABX2FTP1_9BACT|nr:hypothetical protein [Hymenobacter caeli]NRT19714.1 hypothetical protein [Hymenobacter caeli]
MAKLYLDIDGVLLTSKHTRAAPGVDAFVAFVTQQFECYWLTTHCKGDSRSALKYLAQFLLPATLEQLKDAVHSTNWDTLKTEAIALESDFYWVDDNPFQAEITHLEANRVVDRLIIVDLNHPNELATVQAKLKLQAAHRPTLINFNDHLTAQYGKPGDLAREEFEEGFKDFMRVALPQIPLTESPHDTPS